MLVMSNFDCLRGKPCKKSSPGLKTLVLVFMNRLVRRAVFVMISLVAVAIAQAQPANDNFANAWTISGVLIATNGSVAGATRETGEPRHAGLGAGHSVWFNWTAPSTGAYQIDTLFSSFDTVLAVYTGSPVNALTQI